MCGACPGGAGITRLSAYAALNGIKPEVAALLQRAAGRSLRIQAFGDQWVLSTPTGAQRVVHGLEEVADAIAAKPLDWDAVAELTGTPITGTAPRLHCPALPDLQAIASAAVQQPQPSLSAGAFTAGLLARAANARS